VPGISHTTLARGDMVHLPKHAVPSIGHGLRVVGTPCRADNSEGKVDRLLQGQALQ